MTVCSTKGARNAGFFRATAGVLLAFLVLIGAACTSDEDGSEPTTTRGTGNTAQDAGEGESGGSPGVSTPQDSLIDFGDEPRPVGYRGGSISPEAFSKVDPDEEVETPMPLLFAAGVDAKLSDRARNQVRTVLASATEDRGDVARVDPLWIQRDADGNVALLVIVDNPTTEDLTGLNVRAELLKPNDESNGVASFEIPPEEVLGVPAGSAAFLVLTMDQDRLDDNTADVTRSGVRLDLVSG